MSPSVIQRSTDLRADPSSSPHREGSREHFLSPKPIRSGTELIQATRPFASDSAAKSWWYVLSTGGLLILSLVGAFWIAQPALRLASSVLAGLLMLRLFVIYHDQQHHAILDRSRLAERFMWLFGVWALSPSSVWRSSHNHHHNHNSKLRGSHIGSFPIMTLENFQKTDRGTRVKYLFMRHPLTLLLGYVFVFLFGMCLNPFFNSPRKHWDGLLALVVHSAIGVGLVMAGGWSMLFPIP